MRERCSSYSGRTVARPASRACAIQIRFIVKPAFRCACVISRRGRVKVNDRRGNPIEIAAVVVWQVVDTAEASFQVDDYENYVHVQSEAAVRNLATGYAYDAHEEEEVSLVTHTAEVSDQLKTEIQERLAQAGVEVLEARVSHLA